MGGIILGRNIHPALRRALLGEFGGMLPRENFFKWCNLVRFGVYLDQILSLQNFKSYYFLYIFIYFILLVFITLSFGYRQNQPHALINYYYYIKSKYFRYTLASYGIILLKKCLEAFHD